MREILYDGKHEVSIDEVIEKINHFLCLGEEGQSIYESDKNKAMEIAKDIRKSMEKEYKSHNLKKVEDIYEDSGYFYDYSGAVHDVVASITGRLTYDNLYSFLYDVSDYMKWAKNSLKGRIEREKINRQ